MCCCSLVPFKQNGKEVYLRDGEWSYDNVRNKLAPVIRHWPDKLEKFIDDVVSIRAGLAVLIGDSGTERAGGMWDVARRAHGMEKYRTAKLTTVAVSAQKMQVWWGEGVCTEQTEQWSMKGKKENTVCCIAEVIMFCSPCCRRHCMTK